MAAIFDFWQTQPLEIIPTSLSVFPDPENMSLAVEISLQHAYELRYTLFPMYFQWMAGIFDFRQTQTSDSIPTGLSSLPDLENMA